MWFLILRLADLHLALLWRVVRQPRGGDLIALLIFENLLLFHSRLPLLHFHLGGRNQTFNYLLTCEWPKGHNVFLMNSSKPPLLVSSCLCCLVPFWAAWADTRLSPAAVWPEVSCWGHLEESNQRYMNVINSSSLTPQSWQMYRCAWRRPETFHRKLGWEILKYYRGNFITGVIEIYGNQL